MDSAETDKLAKRSSRVKEIVIGLIVVLAFAGLFWFTLDNYLQEGQIASAPYEFGDDTQANGLDAAVKVMSIDPVKGELALRVDLMPKGDLTETGGYSANQNLIVYIQSATGATERTFDKGKAISPFDVVVSLDGLVNNYPFDKYTSGLFMYVTAKADKDAEEVDVPVLLDLTGNVPGFSIEAVEDKESSSTTQIINLDVQRSSTVKTVAIAGMLIMWAIGIAVIFLTLSYVVRGRKAEAFAFYSGLLFGLFGLRNSMPGTPAIGTQSDYLSFFWVEAIVAIMMVLTIVVSLTRPQK